MDEKILSDNDFASEQISCVKTDGNGDISRRNLLMDPSNDKAEGSNDNGSFNEIQRQQKISRVLLAAKVPDYDELASLATSHGGFIDDETRRTACEYPE